jgi:hypothetical protein
VTSGPTGDFDLLPDDVKRNFLEAIELIDEQDRLQGGKPDQYPQAVLSHVHIPPL